MKKFIAHAQSYVFRGLLAIIPLLFSLLALKLLYELIDRRVIHFLEQFFPIRQIPGLGILLVLICLYFIGLIVSNVIGRQIFSFFEGITKRIPVIKAIYQVGQQLTEGLNATEGKSGFQKALLIDCNNNGVWTIAFVTGTLQDNQNDRELLRMFVPTVPNPTTGFVFLVKQEQTVDPGWTVEEALKMVISAGIISPASIKRIN